MSDMPLSQAIIETIRQTAVHYGLWFAETVHQQGLETALDAEKEAGDRLQAILERKIKRAMGLGSTAPLLESLDENTQQALALSLAESWLAADGVWFQAVEGRKGMTDAKGVNDACWSCFAPLEARRIAAVLGLPLPGDLDGLKQALGARMYARLNEWEIVDETPDSFVFRMNRCRVQAARQRKGLEDYPCKSGGMVEYTSFANAFNPAIETECVGCPPDPHPAEWHCAWRFTLKG